MSRMFFNSLIICDFSHFLFGGSLTLGTRNDNIRGSKARKGWVIMSLSYKKLWKQLIDRDMTRTELRQATGISSSTFARLSRGDYVASSVIDRICQELKCDVGDMMEVVLDDKSHGTGMSDKRQRRKVK